MIIIVITVIFIKNLQYYYRVQVRSIIIAIHLHSYRIFLPITTSRRLLLHSVALFILYLFHISFFFSSPLRTFIVFIMPPKCGLYTYYYIIYNIMRYMSANVDIYRRRVVYKNEWCCLSKCLSSVHNLPQQFV